MTETPTSRLPNIARDGNGDFRRTIDTVTRDAEACRLHARGWTYERIAEHLHYASRGDAWRAVQRTLVDTARREGADVLRQMMQSELAEVRREAWEDVTHPQCLVDRMGRQVTDENGEPIPDRQQKAASMQVVLKALGQLATLRGLNAPKQSTSASVSMGVGDIESLLKMAQDELVRMEKERGADQRRASTIAATVEAPDTE
jgi:hypothetical protein